MSWWQALLLGIVQGLTEFLPVSSSGHLMIFKEFLGVDAEGFLDFTVLVHLGTVCSTLVVFWGAIWALLKGLFKFKYNDETDYICKLVVSMIPVALVGFLFKDQVEALFGDTLTAVAGGLLFTAALLLFSDNFAKWFKGASVKENTHRNGISYLQALLVGVGQAVAVAPGISRSGTTIATGLISGVKRDVMAQFSFLMVLVPIIGEQLLDVVKSVSDTGSFFSGAVSPVCLLLGFLAAFASGLFACKAMVALVRKAKLSWFALYCAIVAIVILVLGA
ncbi:MAG: undecaprenyl-diphosphate phosphatase [Bacteroidales bacterium]|nr:undecaprenyl-diphosphate phosphatase [Bacteroidales bacterium]